MSPSTVALICACKRAWKLGGPVKKHRKPLPTLVFMVFQGAVLSLYLFFTYISDLSTCASVICLNVLMMFSAPSLFRVTMVFKVFSRIYFICTTYLYVPNAYSPSRSAYPLKPHFISTETLTWADSLISRSYY